MWRWPALLLLCVMVGCGAHSPDQSGAPPFLCPVNAVASPTKPPAVRTPERLKEYADALEYAFAASQKRASECAWTAQQLWVRLMTYTKPPDAAKEQR